MVTPGNKSGKVQQADGRPASDRPLSPNHFTTTSGYQRGRETNPVPRAGGVASGNKAGRCSTLSVLEATTRRVITTDIWMYRARVQ
jgi:hypothetical protein